MSKRSQKRPQSRKPSARPVGYIRARAWQSRQLGEDPMLALFWRDGPAGARRGMLWILSACSQPDCLCREVFVEARTVPDNLASATLTEDHAVRTMIVPDRQGLPDPAADRQVCCAAIDLDTALATTDPRRPHDEALLDWIRAEIDEPVLAKLREAWARVKGKKAPAAPGEG